MFLKGEIYLNLKYVVQMRFWKSLDNYIMHPSNNLYTGYVCLTHSIRFQDFETVEGWTRE